MFLLIPYICCDSFIHSAVVVGIWAGLLFDVLKGSCDIDVEFIEKASSLVFLIDISPEEVKPSHIDTFIFFHSSSLVIYTMNYLAPPFFCPQAKKKTLSHHPPSSSPATVQFQ